MIDPIVTRLGGCFVFAGLVGALLVSVVAEPNKAPSERVAAAEVQHRVDAIIVSRP